MFSADESEVVLELKVGELLEDDEKEIFEKLKEISLRGNKERLTGLRKVQKHWLHIATKKVDKILEKVQVSNIAHIKELLYSGAALVIEFMVVNINQGNSSIRCRKGV